MAYRSSRTRSTYDYVNSRPPRYQVTSARFQTPYNEYEDEEILMEKMRNVLSAYPNIGVPREPTPIKGTIYIGTSADAENMKILKDMKITHLLNCAGGNPRSIKRAKQLYGPDSGIIEYKELGLGDLEISDIMEYLPIAHQYMDYANDTRRKMLVYCPGVSRSGAICLTYMIKDGMRLLEACKMLKDKRRCVLTNQGFMKQVLQFARFHGLHDWDSKDVLIKRYGRRVDLYRIRSAHLPLFV